MIRRLRDEGITVLLISHDFDQVMHLSDQIWVLRQGTVAMITGVDTEKPNEVTK